MRKDNLVNDKESMCQIRFERVQQSGKPREDTAASTRNKTSGAHDSVNIPQITMLNSQ